MWFTIFTALLITTVTIVNCNLINLDNIWTSTSTFHRDHDFALIGHVIKTLPVFIADCLVACQETLRCFSVNYINFHNGTFSCELNWSNKKQSKDSFVRREGYEYAEPKLFLNCEGKSCAQKAIEDDGWFKFNSSLFKMIYNKTTWTGAKAHCNSLGGDLASFGSHTEYRFVQETMLYYDFLMDTRIETYSLHRGAAIVNKDNRKAVYFDGVDGYATVPKFDISKSDFTIAFWFKGAGSNYGFWNIFNDKTRNSKQQFTIYIYYHYMSFAFFNSDGEHLVPKGFSITNIPFGQWHHAAITWNRQTKQYILYGNSVQKILNSTQENVDLFNTGESNYEIGGNDGKLMFNGWISDLVALSQEMKQPEIENLKDGHYFGAWIGLNDIDEEGTLKWSNDQPLTYMSAVQNQDPGKDCVYLRKGKGSILTWNLESCSDEHPFICQKL